MMYITGQRLVIVGRYSVYCTLCFLVLSIFVPLVILQSILNHLQLEYQFSEQNKDKWISTPGNKQIIYQKQLRLFDILNDNQYTIENFNMNTTFKILYDKNTSFDRVEFLGEWVRAKTVQEFTMNKDYNDKKFNSTTISQVRPGVLRAVHAIENRKDG